MFKSIIIITLLIGFCFSNIIEKQMILMEFLMQIGFNDGASIQALR
jgi:hypothetical protein